MNNMEIKLIGITNNLQTQEEMLKFGQSCGRQCYSGKDFEELYAEPYKSELTEGRLLKSGHHSPFEHVNLTFSMKGIPKALAMVLNNEKQYATSEKSARYTIMKDIQPRQRELYDKWMGIFEKLITGEYPESKFPKLYAKGSDNKTALQKLAQENARYMTSVFTPTKMDHTMNLRQLNFIIDELKKYDSVCRHKNGGTFKPFELSLWAFLPEFLDQLKQYKIPGLENQTDRHLSMFNFQEKPEHFSDVYSTNYFISFAGLAQADRHRTISYNMQTPEKEAPYGFFVPKLIHNTGLDRDWIKDLAQLATGGVFPQAQLVRVRERGNIEDFRSKCILRLCGHAQNEIMENTKQTAKRYAVHEPEVTRWIAPKCQQGIPCRGSCIWGGELALERLV